MSKEPNTLVSEEMPSTNGSGAQKGTAKMQADSSLFPNYARYPLTLVKGQGSWLWDDQGKRYLDFMSGIAVTNLGHAPQAVAERLKKQIDELWHVSNLFHIPGQERAAALLTANSSADAVFFCNSGAEANEAAIKLARRYHQKVKQTGCYEIITFTQSFHGRTLATLTATGQDKVKEGFLPLPAGFKSVPLHDQAALEAAINENTAAIMLEMVQAEGGMYPVDPAFVNVITKLCQEHGLLLIIDEVQTGMGRTGKLFSFEHYGIEPDIFTLAKGLGSGFSVGAMLGKEYLREAFTAGSHGSTFGGTPLAMAAVQATVETIIDDKLPERAAEMGDYLFQSLQKQLADIPFVQDIRGKGLMVGIECAEPVAELVLAGQKKGILFITAGPNVIRLLPNLYVTKEEIDQAVAWIAELIREHVA
ncbi:MULTISPECIES: acetylornithine transaminase [Paenibacillus]|uniref:acetylornithine transaminase n=1 Tax=Paenibacillus TaxID=44249 RepID=UPI000D30E58B|nr:MULTISPECIES: acetylornithine transaminase [Paenibacillus]KAF6621118.1 acetylornithine transaminase [Paenibacillus sp. EKM101P]KAF6622422.1 acetylornithine transaminase [Paenibacillus sp. EKM102P]KAF6632270.1 acetylornithine transaminase [Paenibacillus sp. EKM10P]KAF6647026.1 acetylornithine transaminase [Paenibacillus sp. EKM11P]PTU47736.1 acetylornithine transaminase [Paenibacillus polymyxa]